MCGREGAMQPTPTAVQLSCPELPGSSPCLAAADALLTALLLSLSPPAPWALLAAGPAGAAAAAGAAACGAAVHCATGAQVPSNAGDGAE